MEIEIAYRAIIRKMPNLRLASDRIEQKSTLGLRGLNSLEVIAG